MDEFGYLPSWSGVGLWQEEVKRQGMVKKTGIGHPLIHKSTWAGHFVRDKVDVNSMNG
jgi:hypothetical protein